MAMRTVLMLCAPSCEASRKRVASAPRGRDAVLGAFLLDQSGEPRNVGLGRRAAVLHEGSLVIVLIVGRGRDRGLDRLEPLGERGAAPVEQTDPRLGREVAEEDEADPEPGVLRLGVGRWLLEQLEEQLLTGGRDPVDET